MTSAPVSPAKPSTVRPTPGVGSAAVKPRASMGGPPVVKPTAPKPAVGPTTSRTTSVSKPPPTTVRSGISSTTTPRKAPLSSSTRSTVGTTAHARSPSAVSATSATSTVKPVVPRPAGRPSVGGPNRPVAPPTAAVRSNLTARTAISTASTPAVRAKEIDDLKVKVSLQYLTYAENSLNSRSFRFWRLRLPWLKRKKPWALLIRQRMKPSRSLAMLAKSYRKSKSTWRKFW